MQSSAAWLDVEREFFATARAAVVHSALTQLVDAAVIEAYQSSVAPVLSTPAAVLAMGSFARCEMFPFSDVEIVIVRADDPQQNPGQAAAEFARLLREKGLHPSQRVCTFSECLGIAEQSIDFGITLLDRRLLAGDPALAAKLEDELVSFFAKRGQQLAQRLIALTRARHAKCQNTPSHKEPDVMGTPGGLQDMRAIVNLEKLCPEQLQSTRGLEDAAAFLSSVRCFLHYRAREDRNCLDLGAQEALVERLAHGTTSSAWMQEYFRQARAVFNEARHALDSCEATSGALLDAFRDRQSRLSNAEFSVVRGQLYLRRSGDLGVDQAMLFRLLEFVAAHGVPPAPDTERRLEGVADAVAAFCREPRPLWPAIKTVLSLPHAAKACRVLHNTGLLASIFPEWAGITGLAADNVDHLYTIDEHTLVALERICDLREMTDAPRQRFSELLSETENQPVLAFALLFHHIGGSADDPDAHRVSATVARKAAARIQIPPSDQELLEFLIERQDNLVDVVSGRDLDDPGTVRLLARQIGTIERLRELAILTYAKLAATYSEVKLPWRLEQLWRTYLTTQRELTRELETDRIQELPESLAQSAEFVKGFPTRYLRARSTEEIQAHTRLYEVSRSSGVAVQLDEVEGVYKLTVIARDMPALFASFAGAMSSFGLDIVKAEAFSNAEGVILDTFIFADPKRTLQLNPSEAERLQDLIRRVALGKTDARRLFRNRPHRESKRRTIEPQVQFDSEVHETATLVEIMAEDRPGLLYSLATVFSSNGCNIDTVLIDTKGQRAIDVFYVAQNGKKLSSESQDILKEQLLAACVSASN
jgi:[protein-PII] uridylyltransferase